MTKHHVRGRSAGPRRGLRTPLALAGVAVALILVVAVLVGVLGAGGKGGATAGQPQLERGRELYAQSCASCHGANLEGQANAQALIDQGLRPAPPHDETGHTWHHGDAYLLDAIRQGVGTMPGYAGTLSDDDMRAILAYIKSSWPPAIRAQQPR